MGQGCDGLRGIKAIEACHKAGNEGPSTTLPPAWPAADWRVRRMLQPVDVR